MTFKNIGLGILSFLLPFITISCNAIYDDEGNCDYRYYAKYVYDMNMLYSDAFPSKVNSVDLYVFDATDGKLVAKFSENGEALSHEGYLMPLDLEPGEYEFIAWCGLHNNNNHFTVNSNISHKTHTDVKLSRSEDTDGVNTQSENLHALFHGSLQASLSDKPGDHVYTIYLTKDTNNINVSMQHLSEEFEPGRFSIVMSANNGYLAHDNSLKDDELIIYRPWSLKTGSAEIGSKAEGKTNFLQAEISTSRLTIDHNPIITVTDNNTGETVFSIPITQWALQLRSMNYQNMGDQEYLDREDEFNVMLFLDNKDDGWFAASILINGWHLIENTPSI